MLTLDQQAQNWLRLVEVVSSVCGDDLAKLLEFYRHGSGFLDSENAANNYTSPGLYDAPAGTGVHHIYQGGLVAHYLEMWDIHTKIYSSLSLQDVDLYGHLKPEEILETIVLHDLHKGWYCFRSISAEGKKKTPDRNYEYLDYPPCKMMDANSQTLYMCMRAGYKVSNATVMNALLNSEGGFAKNPTKWQSVLAKYVYLLDELSSNIMSRLQDGNVFDVRDRKLNAVFL